MSWKPHELKYKLLNIIGDAGMVYTDYSINVGDLYAYGITAHLNDCIFKISRTYTEQVCQLVHITIMVDSTEMPNPYIQRYDNDLADTLKEMIDYVLKDAF